MEITLKRNFRGWALIGAVMAVATQAPAQVPDLLTAFDAGGRSLGMGSSIGVTSTGPQTAITNPAALGYMTAPQFSVTMRNLTRSRTTLRRNFVDPDIDTEGKSGRRSVTQLGYATPIGRGGTLGFNYSVGGYIDDFKTGTNLVDGGLIYRNYQEILRAKTDYFTVSWGRANSDSSRSIGIGVTFAAHNTRNLQAYQVFDNNGTPNDTNDDTFISNQQVNNSGDRYGVGLVAGVQWNVGNDTTMGASIRTPITLSGDEEVEDYYTRIPGRVSLGAARRLNVGREEDFALIAAQADYFFGSSGRLLDRDNQFVFGIGGEYHYRMRGARIPFRFGVRSIGKGGDGFKQFSSLTFGLGYNPDGSNYSFDLDFGSNSTGGMDMSLGFSYRFNY